MKRNLDLVRNILLQVEKSENYLELTDLLFDYQLNRHCSKTHELVVTHNVYAPFSEMRLR